MPIDTLTTGPWTVPAGVTSATFLAIQGGADYASNGNVSTVVKQGGGNVITNSTFPKAGNAGVGPGNGGVLTSAGTNYTGGQGGINSGGSYGGGGGGGAGSGGGGGNGATGDPGGQVGGAGGGGGPSGNGFSTVGGVGGQGFPTTKGGGATGVGASYGGGSGGGPSGYGGGGGGASVVTISVTPGDIYDIVVATAISAYAGAGFVAVSYTAAGGAANAKPVVIRQAVNRSASY